jgi:hypothetical protein
MSSIAIQAHVILTWLQGTAPPLESISDDCAVTLTDADYASASIYDRHSMSEYSVFSRYSKLLDPAKPE